MFRLGVSQIARPAGQAVRANARYVIGQES